MPNTYTYLLKQQHNSPIFITLAVGTYFCSHVEHMHCESCCSDLFPGLLGWPFCAFSLVPLFLCIRCLLCFSRPSVACFHVTYCFSTFLSHEAVMDTSCSALSCFQITVFTVFCLFCNSNCTVLAAVRQRMFYNSGSSWSICLKI